ncbi:MAG: LLM class F420-dependent oxidoreductase, partial [Gammaproteobacteria bacterium]|nr:LLM class F420-dependent oxidoreductase [Gammaproteobacteria bacterium]NIR96528.1 LLM class F420-dependent oxidoreductase [Gammaproteobacteria bacterium]NIT62266.1 LLM class F420-dependent oxidoreductase [Gammaproteobacteria bacterium]NIV19117.1 LLM class F420-dependent oxidoreductase [Gammaproteobacteria bacterium]NIX10043.1 LLM class F420-dependent oxidoreductase [Gammaproteobacteria bacterium]
MKLGVLIGYSGAKVSVNLPLVQEADRLGYHVAWSAEAY